MKKFKKHAIWRGAMLAGTLAAGTTAVEAYTLSEPTLASSLGQPLRVHFTLQLQPGEQEPSSIIAADDSVYAKLGLEAPDVRPGDFQISSTPAGDSTWDIVVQTQYGVREPLLPIVLEIHQGRSVQYRAEQLMLDPPELFAASTPAPVLTAASGPAAEPAAPQPQPVHRRARHQAAPADSVPSLAAPVRHASSRVLITRFKLDEGFHSYMALPVAAAPVATTPAAVPEQAKVETAAPPAAEPAAPPVAATVAPVAAAPRKDDETAVAASAPEAAAGESTRSTLARVLTVVLLSLAGFVVWLSRRGSAPAGAVLSPPPARKPLDEAPEVANQAQGGSDPGRVTPINSARAVRNTTPRAIGK